MQGTAARRRRGGRPSVHGRGHPDRYGHAERVLVHGFSGEPFGEIARHKVQGLVSGCREYLLVAVRAGAAAGTARADLAAVLVRERGDIRSVTGEIRFSCLGLKADVRTAANDRFHAYLREVTGRLADALRGAMPGWEGNLARVAGQWADAVGAVIDLLSREAAAFIERELCTIEGLVGASETAAARAEEIRAALSELDVLESAIS